MGVFVLKRKVFCSLLLVVFCFEMFAQTDYSDSWEDFYSYVNAKSVVKNGNFIYVIVDNGVFSVNEDDDAVQKFSSVHGLSGEATSAICYSSAIESFVVAYESGLFEIVATDGAVQRVVDIVLSEVSSQKGINALYEVEGMLYLATSFGIVLYDLVSGEFVDTFFVGANSSLVSINDIILANGDIYASSDDGIYRANLSENLNDANNWIRFSSGVYTSLGFFDGDLLVAKDKKIYKIDESFNLNQKVSVSAQVTDFHTDGGSLIVGTSSKTEIYNGNYQKLHSIATPSNGVFIDGQKIYLATSDRGVLRSQLSNPEGFTELHPDGPLNNQAFSISVKNQDLWVVYGGFSYDYKVLHQELGVTHYNGEAWVQIPYNSAFPAADITQAAIDPNHANRVYLSSYKHGILVLEDDVPIRVLNYENSGLARWIYSGHAGIEHTISGVVFDENGSLWVANTWTKGNEDISLQKMEANAVTSSIKFSNNSVTGINTLFRDNYKNVYMGTTLGLWIYNEDTNQTAIVNTEDSKGKLPELNVRAVAVDKNQRVWIGSEEGGLVYFDDMQNVYSGSFSNAERLIIVDDGTPKELLGSVRINDIYIDGSDTKWFATHSGGVVHTNSTGQETLHLFNEENSPLPSNEVLEIQMDESTGKVFFLTSKGIVAYNSDIASHGDALSEVYGYPNPALKQHSEVTIVGADGQGLPFGTNVKIVDVAGNLVFESNTIEELSPYGGKIVWDKTNLAGNPVASGVYIVLLYNEAGQQTSSSKIAVIN